jgi:hypothetical protein
MKRKGKRDVTPITIELVLLGIFVAYWGVTAFTGNPHLKPEMVLRKVQKINQHGN